MKAKPTPPRKRMDRSDLFWLVYLAFFFIEPVLRRSVVFWLESLGIVAIFIALYIGFLRLREVRLRALMLAAMYLLGFATYPVNNGAIAFFIYAAALLPFLVASTSTVLLCFAAESILVAVEGWMLHGNPYDRSLYNTAFAIFFIIVVGGSNIFFAQKQRAEAKLRMAQEENIALAAVAERERIARDLHDVLGHTLSVIVLKAELAGRLLARGDDTTRAAAEIADVEHTARNALAEVRETIGGYRARGLTAEIDAARNALSTAGVRLEIEGIPVPGSLYPAEETVLALALREAVTNIVRHAQATTCTLHFAMENGRHTLVIQDDGQHVALHEGNGLRGMRERVESLGGTLELQREHGTRVLIASWPRDTRPAARSAASPHPTQCRATADRHASPQQTPRVSAAGPDLRRAATTSHSLPARAAQQSRTFARAPGATSPLATAPAAPHSARNSQPSTLPCDPCRVHAVRRAQLRNRLREIVPHGAFTQTQLRRNLRGCPAVARALQNLALAVVQRIGICVPCLGCKRRVDRTQAFMYPPNRSGELTCRSVLQQIATRPRVECTAQIARSRKGRQDNDARLRSTLLQRRSKLQPRPFRHLDVSHGDIRLQFACQSLGLAPVRGLCHHVNVRLHLQQSCQRTAHHRLVLGNQHANLLCARIRPSHPALPAAFAGSSQLLRGGHVYACSCSRRDLQEAVQAPHEEDDEPVYSGQCRPAGERETESDELQPFTNYRLRVRDGEAVRFVDGYAGAQSFTAGCSGDADFGDFVVWRKDGLPSYQLACAVDDGAMGVTEVVRGRDLLKSTARQMLLQRALGLPTPQYFHCDLMRDEAGSRLAKRHDALSLRAMRERGLTPAQVIARFGQV